MKIEINGHTVEVDPNFQTWDAEKQQQYIDDVAADLGPAKTAAAQPQQAAPDVLSNVVAGAEGAAIASGKGVPKALYSATKNYFTGTPAAAPPPQTVLPGDERWYNSANAINEKAKIVRRNNELAKRYPGFERKIAPEVQPTMPQKVVGGLSNLSKSVPGKGFTAGYNLMDVGEHAGTGPLGNVQATASGVAAAAPYLEKHLPKGLKKYAAPVALGTPAVNYAIDTIRSLLPQDESVLKDTTLEKATGGLVHLAKGSSVLKKGLELAREALPPLPRAPAKSKEEIYAIAQRMAPQQLGQFAQAPGKTTSVAGKSRKQFEREQGLGHDIVETPHQLSDLPDIDYSKNIGAVATGLPGDKSGVATIHGVAGTKLEAPSIQEGGAPYGLHYQATNPDTPPELWASTGDAARRYMNFGRQVAHQYGTENILPHYMSMPQGMGYAQHYADVNLKGLRPAGADLDKLADIIRGGSFKGKTFQDFPGFGNMDEVYELMKHNPELRQFFNNRLQVQDVAKSVGLPPTYGTDTLHAVTLPGLRDVETGAGGNVIGKLDLRREMTPTAHNTYTPGRDPGLNIPGEAIGSSKYLMPYDLMYADSLQAVRNNPAQAPQEFGSLKMIGPRQKIDQQFVDEIGMYREAMKRLTGKAAGGKIVKAASDLILPAAENAARTQIIGTLPTYAKAAEALAKHGAQGRAIDFGAGLGEGAKLLGKNVDTYEPFAKNWTPTFTNAADIPSDAYNRLTNLNVLNVVPRETRDEIVQNIGRVMEPGGTGIVTTRGADVMKAQGQLGPEPMSMITSRDTYQKGFTKQELEDYLKYILGQNFEVNKFNLGPAGVLLKKK